MLVFRTEIHKMHVRLAKRDDTDQTTSAFLSMLFWQGISVYHFRTVTIEVSVYLIAVECFCVIKVLLVSVNAAESFGVNDCCRMFLCI